MKGCFWNCDGFRDTAKHWYFHESIREHKLVFFAIQETGRDNFSAPFLRFLAAGLDFAWYCLPPQGRSGGILVGINLETILVKGVNNGDRCVKFDLTSKGDGFEWSLVTVYGAAQDEHKQEFLAELVRICEQSSKPLLIGVYFNILRRKEDKSNENFNSTWPFLFNAIIESLELKEIHLFGRQYTWASRRDTPTYEKLDRILSNVEWEQKFPLVMVRALERAGSDHTPLLLDSGDRKSVV